MTDCWEWQGYVNPYGYGMAYVTIGPNRARYITGLSAATYRALHGSSAHIAEEIIRNNKKEAVA
jgi:hypothetical protein